VDLAFCATRNAVVVCVAGIFEWMVRYLFILHHWNTFTHKKYVMFLPWRLIPFYRDLKTDIKKSEM
jgi:hypothetical protein